MKKLWASLLALVMMFSFVACGDNSTEPDNNDGGGTDTSTEESKDDTAEGPVELTYMLHASGDNKEKIEKAVNDRLKELDKNYTVKFIIFSWDNYDQKVALAAKGASADEQFDLATTASWLGPFATLAKEGSFYDLNPILEEAAPKLAETLTDAQMKGASIDGKLYGIQTIIDKAPMARDHYIWNVEQLESIGFTEEDVKDATDLDSIEPFIKAWKEKNPEKYPMRANKDSAWAFRRLGNYVRTNEDGSYEIEEFLKSDELKQRFEKVAEYREAGYIHPEAGLDIAEGTQQEPDTWLVAKGEGEPGAIADWTQQNETPIAAYPIPEDDTLYNDAVQGKLTAVYAHTEHPKEALNFIETMRFDETIQDLMAYGIEGEEYELVDGKVKLAEEREEWSPWANQWSNDVRTPLETALDIDSPEMQERIKRHNDPIIPSADLGFTPSDELIRMMSDVRTEALADLQVGRLDSYDLFIQDLDSSGYSEVVEKYKEEFEAWKAEQ